MTHTAARPATCPPWCRLRHGVHEGEEDSIHVSAQVSAGNALLRLVATIDPETQELDGPYILVGHQELDLDTADLLASTLARLVKLGRIETPGASARLPTQHTRPPRLSDHIGT